MGPVGRSREWLPPILHHLLPAIEPPPLAVDPLPLAPKIPALPLWFKFDDVVNLIPPLAGRLEPRQNYTEHSLFDFDHITDFELRFIGAALKSLACWLIHHSILTLSWTWVGDE
jgi:hypothetical protein